MSRHSRVARAFVVIFVGSVVIGSFVLSTETALRAVNDTNCGEPRRPRRVTIPIPLRIHRRQQ